MDITSPYLELSNFCVEQSGEMHAGIFILKVTKAAAICCVLRILALRSPVK